MTARELHCTAGHVVGVRLCGAYTGIVEMKHRGQRSVHREWGIIAIECECGEVWRPDPPRLPLDDLELKGPSLAGRG